MSSQTGSPIIGVFDSGIGGLSVLRALRRELPAQPVLYFGDQGHIPYGPRPMEQVRHFSEEVTRFLLARGVELMVVACNAASAAALLWLREQHPDIPFVGMEPAVKPAAEQTRSGKVGVLATPATFQGALYASVVERFARGVTLYQDACPGLVAEIEAGRLNGERTRQILEDALRPMLAAGIDTVVLGCTHYPFVIPLIQEIAGPEVRVIDPAPAVARQTVRMLQTLPGFRLGEGRAQVRFYTSGQAQNMQAQLPTLLGESGEVEAVVWQGEQLPA
jgi:glutamate racemase